MYEIDAPYGQIMAMVVSATHRRQGVGVLLIDAAESHFVERGAAVSIVTSHNRRADAHAFYETSRLHVRRPAIQEGDCASATEGHMTTTSERLVDQLKRSAEGEAWHGPSVREALDGVTVEDASAHPIPGAHSIRELVLHIAAGVQLVLRRLDGDGRQLTPEEDWPTPSEPTADAWQREVESLFALNRRLREAVATFPGARLDEPLVPSRRIPPSRSSSGSPSTTSTTPGKSSCCAAPWVTAVEHHGGRGRTRRRRRFPGASPRPVLPGLHRSVGALLLSTA